MAKSARMYQRRFGVGLVDDEVIQVKLSRFLNAYEPDILVNQANTATHIIYAQANDLRELRKKIWSTISNTWKWPQPWRPSSSTKEKMSALRNYRSRDNMPIWVGISLVFSCCRYPLVWFRVNEIRHLGVLAFYSHHCSDWVGLCHDGNNPWLFWKPFFGDGERYSDALSAGS